MSATKTTEEVLQRAKDTLLIVKLGLRDVLQSGPERRLVGPRNLVVFGRAVTNVLRRRYRMLRETSTSLLG